MAILQEIPLQAVINQTLTTTINNQTLGITIRPLTINNKILYNTTPEYQTEIIQFHPVGDSNVTLPSFIILVMDLTLNGNPIFYNVVCNNAVYLNNFVSDLIGNLFFYKDNWQTEGDIITYSDFNSGKVHLYYSDYDALQADFNSYVQNNLTYLKQTFLYGV
jgi:hypothetical protein